MLLPKLSHSLALIALACAFAKAEAALTLTIDTDARTFSWSGSATSEVYELNQYSYELQIGDEGENGGLGFGYSPLLTTPSTLTNGISAFSSDAGQLILAIRGTSADVHTSIGDLAYNVASPVLEPITVTGNNQAQGFVDQAIPFFEQLNGRTLYFYDVQVPAGGDPIRFGAPVGTIVVIPEASAGMLSLLGGLLIAGRRKRG
jgi:hypothetical protein